ncbi:MAG TPA: hypothetical protein ENJ56_03440, partial [Anaerolineae bacterium]|nr:hypothetical protein [Anaerolineae bacterium]
MANLNRLLIHIGYPKAGSTYLQNWFEQHPAFQFSHGGILGFDDIWQLVRVGLATPASLQKWFVTSA